MASTGSRTVSDALRASLESMVEPEQPERQQVTPAGHRIRIPSREEFERIVKKVAPPPRGHKRPAETDEPPERSER